VPAGASGGVGALTLAVDTGEEPFAAAREQALEAHGVDELEADAENGHGAIMAHRARRRARPARVQALAPSTRTSFSASSRA
jgi:hypothetical protein